MKDNLEDTKPIKTLKELETRSDKYLEDDITNEIESREEKYKQIEEEKINKEDSEKAEEALAEKNINEAEKILKEEEEAKEENEEEEEPEKKGLFAKIKAMPKKKKILLFSCIGIILILIIILLIVLLRPKNEETKTEGTTDEAKPTIVDNFYYKDGKLYILDEAEKVIGEYECNNKDEKLCYVAVNSNRDDFDVARYLDSKGEDKVLRIPVVDNEFVFIVDKKSESENTVNLYSLSEKEIIGSYHEVKAYEGNYYIVKDVQSNYGLIEIRDNKVNDLIKPTYSYLGMISYADNLVAKNNKGYFIIDKSNKVLSDPISEGVITDYSKDLIVVKKDKKYLVYDYKAKILEVDHDFASVIDGYMAVVDGLKLIVKDTDDDKYTEEGVTLKNSNYVRTYTYDENGKLDKKKISYTMELGSGNVVVAVYEEDSDDPIFVNLEIAPVKINKKHKYVNYLDKKLYFYNDEQKETVIGFYSCTNKNFMGTVGDDYDTCYPASDTIYEDNEMTSITGTHVIPIMNFRFVFIKDGDSVNLYDLNDKKSIGSYSSVNTYSNEGNDSTLVEGTFKVVVKNKKGKFGMVQITDTQVTKIYNFEYNQMEKLGKYILAQKESGKWVLLSDSNTSAEYGDKIVQYNDKNTLFKGKTNGNEYTIYDSNAKKLVNDNFKYIEINNNYFVTVNNSNNLNIYDITGEKINNNVITLNSTEYTGSNKAFIVSYSSGVYTVKVKDGDKYVEHKIDEATGNEIGGQEPENNED